MLLAADLEIEQMGQKARTFQLAHQQVQFEGNGQGILLVAINYAGYPACAAACSSCPRRSVP